MANKLKHKKRSQYSSHTKPDFGPFVRNAAGLAFVRAGRNDGRSFMATMGARLNEMRLGATSIFKAKRGD